MAEVEKPVVEDGSELYRELCRWHPDPQITQYHKLGQWQKELLKIDAVLLEEHRKEAGAEPPKPLEEIPKPAVTKSLTLNFPFQQGASSPTLSLPASVAAKAGTTVPTIRPGLKLNPGAQPISPAAVAAAELKAMALFVAKWKLEPTKTKLLLAPLPSVRRRWVLANFKSEGEGEAIGKLEAFIQESSDNDAWPEATTPTVPAGTVVSTLKIAAPKQPGTGGVVPPTRPAAPNLAKGPMPVGRVVLNTTNVAAKRPAPPVLTLDPSKRPKILGQFNGAINPNVNMNLVQQRVAQAKPPGQVKLPGQFVPPRLSSPRPVGVVVPAAFRG